MQQIDKNVCLHGAYILKGETEMKLSKIYNVLDSWSITETRQAGGGYKLLGLAGIVSVEDGLDGGGGLTFTKCSIGHCHCPHKSVAGGVGAHQNIFFPSSMATRL